MQCNGFWLLDVLIVKGSGAVCLKAGKILPKVDPRILNFHAFRHRPIVRLMAFCGTPTSKLGADQIIFAPSSMFMQNKVWEDRRI